MDSSKGPFRRPGTRPIDADQATTRGRPGGPSDQDRSPHRVPDHFPGAIRSTDDAGSDLPLVLAGRHARVRHHRSPSGLQRKTGHTDGQVPLLVDQAPAGRGDELGKIRWPLDQSIADPSNLPVHTR